MIETWSREKVADADVSAFLAERRKAYGAKLAPARLDARDALLVRVARMLGCGHELVREIEADATENCR